MSLSVLYLGPQCGTSLHRREAFKRLGHRVHTIDPRELLPASPWVDRFEWHLSPSLLGSVVRHRLREALGTQRYDLAFVDSGSLVTAATVRDLSKRCNRVVNFNHDDPYGRRDYTRFSAYRAAVPDYDLVIVVRYENIAEAKLMGARKVMFHPRVADEVAHAPRELTPDIRSRWQSDVAFIGTWMPERGPFLMQLIRRGLNVSIFGQGWDKAAEWSQLRRYHAADYLDGDDYAYAVQCARISLGMLSKGNRDLHTTRTMEIPSLGGLLCAQRTGEHQAFYRDGDEAVFWSNADECAKLCRGLLENETRRLAIAANGRRRFLDNGFTSENLIRKMIGAVA